ncbi:MAG: DUF362 domain-containing protein [Desulfomonilaceae bacterium]
MKIDSLKCVGCADCLPICPQSAIKIRNRKAAIDEKCCDCRACLRVCQNDAICAEYIPPEQYVQCEACPIRCKIKEGFLGACQRYQNKAGALERTIKLKKLSDVKNMVGEDWREEIRRPLITAIGAGTTYPDCKPAPHIIQNKVNGIDVVTVVTEAPLSYSGVKIKVDTDRMLGEEGSSISYHRKKVGHLTTEEYGSKMLSLGGVNLLTGPDGLFVARVVADVANRKKIRLKIRNGAELDLQVGGPPLINGEKDYLMRVGCGSATLGLFAEMLKKVADEVIILDSHLTGLMSEHTAGIYVGTAPSGVKLKFSRSTPGRYFGDHGSGWGGTSIINPLEIIESVDSKIAKPGMLILITETTGRQAAMFQLTSTGSLNEIAITVKAKEAVQTIAETCENSRVSAIYCGGSGGSARAGVTKYPIRLTYAVHTNKAKLTVGGAPTFVLPGGGINFMVDVEKVMPGAFSWTPTPATICPIEYTMTLEDYRNMGGHQEAIKPFIIGD